jgi:hypothetical protein
MHYIVVAVPVISVELGHQQTLGLTDLLFLALIKWLGS